MEREREREKDGEREERKKKHGVHCVLLAVAKKIGRCCSSLVDLCFYS